MSRPVAIAAMIVATVATAVPASATFSATASTTGTLRSAILQPASALTLTWSCPPGNSRTAQLSWASSPSSFTTGYAVDRIDPATGDVLSTTLTATTSFSQSVPKRTDVRFRVTAAASNWRSTPVEVSGTAPSGTC